MFVQLKNLFLLPEFLKKKKKRQLKTCIYVGDDEGAEGKLKKTKPKGTLEPPPS